MNSNAVASLYSILAGFFAALGSLLGKFAVSTQSSIAMGAIFKSNVLTSHETIHKVLYDIIGMQNLDLIVRLISFILNITTNSLMWYFFSKSLKYSRSSSQATVINTATNFILSALFGYFVFGEQLPMKWWMGSSLIIAGSWMVHLSSIQEKSAESSKIKKQ